MSTVPSTQYSRLSYDEVADSLPPTVARAALRSSTQSPSHIAQKTLVVLDDDPTGTQTVHDVMVLTTFDKDVLREQLRKRESGFFILTNSRAFAHAEAESLLRTLLKDLREASLDVDAPIEIVLRSDSTLRGHFPLEARLVEEAFGPSSGWILAPAFFEGGRVTVDDVHYVREGSELIPAGQTPFAMDKAFGYRSSNLRDWVSEKFDGTDVPNCQSISIAELRESDATDKIAARLKGLVAHRDSSPDVLILNVFSPADMETFVAARALAPEVNLVYRTGASFVSAYLHIAPIPPLSPKLLFPDSETLSAGVGGLIIIGSYVPKTSAQRTYLLDHCKDHVTLFELDVSSLLASTDQNRKLIVQTARSIEAVIGGGRDAVLSTSRTLITSEEQHTSLEMGRVVSGVLNQITIEVSVKPKYIIAKGGITSSDIATVGLGMKRARVVGQAATGVPLWESAPNDIRKWADVPAPSIAYVVALQKKAKTSETLLGRLRDADGVRRIAILIERFKSPSNPTEAVTVHAERKHTISSPIGPGGLSEQSWESDSVLLPLGKAQSRISSIVKALTT